MVDKWNLYKISTRGTVILSWFLLIGGGICQFFGNGVPFDFVREAFYFAIAVNLGSTVGLNGIEQFLGRRS